ncbi:hypothetical protein ACFLUA_03870 [Chloroflexota bacterium]
MFGILRKWVVTQEELDYQIAERGLFARLGPDTIDRLVNRESGKVAQAERRSEDERFAGQDTAGERDGESGKRVKELVFQV